MQIKYSRCKHNTHSLNTRNRYVRCTPDLQRFGHTQLFFHSVNMVNVENVSGLRETIFVIIWKVSILVLYSRSECGQISGYLIFVTPVMTWNLIFFHIFKYKNKLPRYLFYVNFFRRVCKGQTSSCYSLCTATLSTKILGEPREFYRTAFCLHFRGLRLGPERGDFPWLYMSSWISSYPMKQSLRRNKRHLIQKRW